MAANWQSTESFVVPQAIDETSTVKKNPIGMIINARDISTQPATGTGNNGQALGTGKFIYLVGAASTAAGDAVTYKLPDQTDLEGSTTRVLAGGSGGQIGGTIAVAMSANVASQYGWYQIQGNVVTTCVNGTAAGGPAYIGTVGAVTSTAANSLGIVSSRVVLADGVGDLADDFCLLHIDYPGVFTQVTLKQLS